MKVTVDNKAKALLKKKGEQDIHVFVRGCSS